METKHKIPNRFFIFGAALVWRRKCPDGWNFSFSQRLQFSCIRSSFSLQSSFTRTVGCWQSLGGIGETARIGRDIFSGIGRRSSRWSSKFQIFFVIMAASSFQFPFTRTIGCWQLSGIGEITKIGLYVDIFSRNDGIFVEDG